jgi:hypothetical protein
MFFLWQNPNADIKKEEEERKKKEEQLKKQQSKLRIMEKVPPGCVMYRFKSSMVGHSYHHIINYYHNTNAIFEVQRNFGLCE